MKKTNLILALIAVFAVTLVQPALAAKSATKTFRVSVTLPESVGSIDHNRQLAEGKVIFDYSSRRHNIEETVIVRNNAEIVLRTIVVD